VNKTTEKWKVRIVLDGGGTTTGKKGTTAKVAQARGFLKKKNRGKRIEKKEIRGQKNVT